MKPTIIQISPGAYYDKNLPDIESRHYGSWATPFAKKVLEYTDKYELEIWKCYDPKDYGDHGSSFRERDNITFRLFPAKKYGPKYISFPLLKELDKRIKSGERIIVHLQTLHDIMAYIISWKCRNIPLMAQQRAPISPPIVKFGGRKNPLFLLIHPLDSFSLRNYDFVFAPSTGELDYLKKRLDPDRLMHQKGGGFDFKRYKPRSKEEARKELGLPLDRKILIHVGRDTKLKGVDLIISAFKELKAKDDSIELLLIGGREGQELYQGVMDSGAIVKGFMDREELFKYMCAADVYLLPTEDVTWIPFADIGTAQIESLALNTPNISPLLMHFSGTEEERKKLGIELKDYNNPPGYRQELLDAILYAFEHPDEFRNTRDIVKKYYSWDRIIGNNVKVYDRLLTKYYGTPKPTIIQISPGAYYDKNLPDIESRHYGSWASPFARKTLEYTDKYKLEIWKCYDPKDYGDHGTSIRERDNITYRLFPAKKYGIKYISFPLLKELDKRLKSGEKIIVHLQTLHTIMAYLISRKCRKIPLVAQQRTPVSPPIIKFGGRKNPLYLLMQPIDSMCLKYYDFIFAPSIGEYEYLKKKLPKDKFMFLKGGGFDFEKYQVRPKEEVRKELGLPLDKKIMSYVGRYTELQGLHIILEMYERMKKERGDVVFVIIGGNDTQPLYQDVMNSDAIKTGLITRAQVVKYLNASDVFVLPSEDYTWIPFSDIATSQIEALAVNTPNVSPLLIHFVGTREERDKLGFVAETREDVRKGVEFIFDKPDEFTNTREIMAKYYTWEKIISTNVNKYEELLKKYYV